MKIKMRIKTIKKFTGRIIMPLCVLCSLPILASCDDDAHEQETGTGVTLTWQDPENEDTPVSDIRLWMYTADGTETGDYHYTDTREFGKELWQLPAGEYTFVATANLVEPFRAESTTTARSRAAGGTLLFSLSDASASPEHAYYSVEGVTVTGNEIKVSEMPLKRILAELVIAIEGVPDGTVLTGTVNNAATGIYPLVKNADNGYGTESAQAVTVNIPETTAQGRKILTKTLRLMPTVAGASETVLSLRLRQPDGATNDFTLKAPLMKIGGKYRIELNFAEMKPIIYLSPVIIDEWTEGWGINGEILNPES